jgi:hypothetical protein
MDNHKLEQTIENISEEMAQALIDAFEKNIEATQELHEKVTEFLWAAAENAVLCAAEAYAKATLRYTKATFLTRWYKKRKMEKAEASLNEAIEFYNKWHDSCKEEKA